MTTWHVYTISVCYTNDCLQGSMAVRDNKNNFKLVCKGAKLLTFIITLLLAIRPTCCSGQDQHCCLSSSMHWYNTCFQNAICYLACTFKIKEKNIDEAKMHEIQCRRWWSIVPKWISSRLGFQVLVSNRTDTMIY